MRRFAEVNRAPDYRALMRDRRAIVIYNETRYDRAANEAFPVRDFVQVDEYGNLALWVHRQNA